MARQKELVEILVRCEGGAFKAAHTITDELIYEDGELIARRPGKAVPATKADVEGYLTCGDTLEQVASLLARVAVTEAEIERVNGTVKAQAARLDERQAAVIAANRELEAVRADLALARRSLLKAEARERDERALFKTVVEQETGRPFDAEGMKQVIAKRRADEEARQRRRAAKAATEGSRGKGAKRDA